MDPARPTSRSEMLATQQETTAGGRAFGALPFRLGYFRWVICALLLLGTTKNYMDRWALSGLKTTLQHDLGWSEIDYGNLVFAFQAAYAVGMLAAGRFIDRLGTRAGYAIVMIFWSVASMAQIGRAHV